MPSGRWPRRFPRGWQPFGTASPGSRDATASMAEMARSGRQARTADQALMVRPAETVKTGLTEATARQAETGLMAHQGSPDPLALTELRAWTGLPDAMAQTARRGGMGCLVKMARPVGMELTVKRESLGLRAETAETAPMAPEVPKGRRDAMELTAKMANAVRRVRRASCQSPRNGATACITRAMWSPFRVPHISRFAIRPGNHRMKIGAALRRLGKTDGRSSFAALGMAPNNIARSMLSRLMAHRSWRAAMIPGFVRATGGN